MHRLREVELCKQFPSPLPWTAVLNPGSLPISGTKLVPRTLFANVAKCTVSAFMVLNFQLIFWLNLFLPPLQLVQLLLLNCICCRYFPGKWKAHGIDVYSGSLFFRMRPLEQLWQLVYMAVGILNRRAENENYVNLHTNSTLQNFVLC